MKIVSKAETNSSNSDKNMKYVVEKDLLHLGQKETDERNSRQEKYSHLLALQQSLLKNRPMTLIKLEILSGFFLSKVMVKRINLTMLVLNKKTRIKFSNSR